MTLDDRAARYAALGDPIRLALVDDLVLSDRASSELTGRHGLASNLLAHHLGVLERAGLIERSTSQGDGRRRYVRLLHDRLWGIHPGAGAPDGPVLFVCTRNSARSQMAAALWTIETGWTAASAGTHPAERVHPGAVDAAARAGIDLGDAVPRHIDDLAEEPAQVITVCDRAHEELHPDGSWHWSIPDPVESASADAFDEALDRIRTRIRVTTRGMRS